MMGYGVEKQLRDMLNHMEKNKSWLETTVLAFTQFDEMKAVLTCLMCSTPRFIVSESVQ